MGRSNKDPDYMVSMEERTDLEIALKILLWVSRWVSSPKVSGALSKDTVEDGH